MWHHCYVTELNFISKAGIIITIINHIIIRKALDADCLFTLGVSFALDTSKISQARYLILIPDEVHL